MTGTPVSRPTGRFSLSDPLQTLTDEHIVAQIPPGSRVLDLGCGDGRLLEVLRDTHGASVQGIELDRASLVRAMERGWRGGAGRSNLRARNAAARHQGACRHPGAVSATRQPTGWSWVRGDS